MVVRVNRKPRKRRILIVGGGFGGVYSAIHLQNLLAREGEVEICLVSRDNYFLFTPMLHEIAASDLEITNIVNPLRKLLRKAEVIVGDVTQIDLPNNRVRISRGHGEHSQEIDYDHLVIALGSISNYYNLPGVCELALAMKSLSDAVRLRAHVLRRLEEANSECNPIERQSLLTFVVAGGGFAGVETVAALNDFVHEALPFYPNLSETMLQVILVHSGPVILPELGESLGQYTHKVLAQRGMEIRLNTRVKSMTKDKVFFDCGAPIPCRTLVWTAATVPNPLISSLPCAKQQGRIRVNEFLRVFDWPNIWAVGDCAFVPDVRNPGKSHPPTAQHAIREGKIVAHNIAAAFRVILENLFRSRPSDCWLQSVTGQVSREFLVLTSPASSPGGCGGRFISASYPVWTKRCGWHSIGHSTSYFPRTFAPYMTSTSATMRILRTALVGITATAK